jgi:hypothetical protein
VPLLVTAVPPEYVAALGLRSVDGRRLAPADIAGSPRPVVISESFADSIGGPATAIGATLTVRSAGYNVVGIVGDVACGSLRSPRCARMFVAASNTLTAQTVPQIGVDVAMRTRGDAADTAPAVRQVAARLFPNAVRLEVRTGHDLVSSDLGEARMGAWFFSGFGQIGLVLGLGGLFGLVVYFAESRRREFGIRLALGATPSDVTRRIVGAGLWPVLAGVPAGLIVAATFARSVDAWLVGISRLDPLSFGASAVLLVAGAAAAGLLAAWRVRGLSPMDALRLA